MRTPLKPRPQWSIPMDKAQVPQKAQKPTVNIQEEILPKEAAPSASWPLDNSQSWIPTISHARPIVGKEETPDTGTDFIPGLNDFERLPVKQVVVELPDDDTSVSVVV